MKNKVKLIIAFILGAIIFGTISAYAMSKYMSKDIGFTPSNSNWHVTNVEDAINDLYNNSKPLVVGNYLCGKEANFEELSGLLIDCYNDNEYLEYDVENYKVTVKKAGNYNINYSLGTILSQSYQPKYRIIINGQELDSTTIGTSARSSSYKEVNVDLNVGDEIQVAVKGGANFASYISTTILYNGAK